MLSIICGTYKIWQTSEGNQKETDSQIEQTSCSGGEREVGRDSIEVGY